MNHPVSEDNENNDKTNTRPSLAKKIPCFLLMYFNLVIPISFHAKATRNLLLCLVVEPWASLGWIPFFGILPLLFVLPFLSSFITWDSKIQKVYRINNLPWNRPRVSMGENSLLNFILEVQAIVYLDFFNYLFYEEGSPTFFRTSVGLAEWGWLIVSILCGMVAFCDSFCEDTEVLVEAYEICGENFKCNDFLF